MTRLNTKEWLQWGEKQTVIRAILNAATIVNIRKQGHQKSNKSCCYMIKHWYPLFFNRKPLSVFSLKIKKVVTFFTTFATSVDLFHLDVGCTYNLRSDKSFQFEFPIQIHCQWNDNFCLIQCLSKDIKLFPKVHTNRPISNVLHSALGGILQTLRQIALVLTDKHQYNLYLVLSSVLV